jgi:hypothetical protein
MTMARDVLLRRVAAVHALLVVALAILLRRLGWPLDGLLLGAGLAGFSFVTFWVVARAVVEPRHKAIAYALGALKILLYLALTAAVLSGRLVADAAGFAFGVTCFVGAVVGVGLLGSRADAAGNPVGSA